MMDSGVPSSFSMGMEIRGPRIIITTLAMADRAMQFPMLRVIPSRSLAP